ncbi:hypothetical protein ASPZODRAFT_95177 [Penicilliopsis zonata CBS 506.65]|uniref:Enoyl reductase (ER) domain-containing protein n=1 Tax=Penicilliopsis zonata CBS 506.65 TaxID=1073090 RepID=A0A1L9SLD7_9EURO|nr:hypothetical protein ASPZODRAFT_95177 [Penicilliopsis zonata CBS 506.65]OJJ48029.1 hypothetical protein ASPZODRAFT_95177 [Penicilliopsis zonata CBS 506.65]
MTETMKAVVYTGAALPEVQERPKPVIEAPGDALVQMLYSTICGTDLHILRGDVPTVDRGRVLGHEGVGRIVAVGSAVPPTLCPGDIVLLACITACRACAACHRGMCSHCTGGGWQLGNLIDGTQAEYVRVPHAAGSLYPLPESLDPQAAVALSDALPTGMECGTLNARIAPGCSVAIVGAGPVGLAALLTARLSTPARIVVFDLDEARLAHARRLGADETLSPLDAGAVDQLLDKMDVPGFDAVIEAVGIPQTFSLCQRLVGPGGVIANVGVHGQPVSLALDKLWDRNITITTRLVDAVTIPTLMRLWQSNRLDPGALITDNFPFSNVLDAYRRFQEAANTGTLKVGITF